jgi:hypothetical protein
VLVRVVSNRLSDDIRDAVRDAVRDAGKEIDKDGEGAGRRLNDSIAKGLREDEKLRQAGEKINASVAEGMRKDEKLRIAGEKLNLAIADGLRKDEKLKLAGQRVNESVANGMRRDEALKQAGERAAERLQLAIDNGIRKDEALRQSGQRVNESIANGLRRDTALQQAADRATDKLKADIANGLRRDRALDLAGQRVNESIANGMRRDQTLRLAGERATQRISEAARTAAQRDEGLRIAGQRLNEAIANGMRRDRALELAGQRVADRAAEGIRRGNQRNRSGLLASFRGLGSDLGSAFNLGIGAARMGAAVISALAVAGPSLIAGVGAILTALAADIVNFIAAIGPGVAGAIGVGLAAVSSLALTAGLLFAAFKSGVPGLAQLSKDFKDLVKVIGTPIAQNMLGGMTAAVQTLHDRLPLLNDMLAETGKAFGRVSVKIADTVTSSANLSRINSILGTNVRFIDSLGDAMAGLTTSFLILFKAAKPFVDFVGDAVKSFSEWAQASLEVSEANGNLGRWMDQMLQNFKDLWKIVKDFGRGIGNIFKAAAPAGASLLASLTGIAERFRAWTSDTGNMARMTAFFEKARILSSKVLELVGALFTAGGNAFSGMDLGPILHALDTLKDVVAPAIARIFNQIQKAAGPNLVKIFDNIGKTFTKIADSGVIGKVAGALSGLFVVLTDFLASDFGAQLAGVGLALLLFGGILKPIIELGGALAGVFGKLGPALAAMSGPALAIAAAVAAIVGVFILAWTNSEKFRTAVGQLWEDLQANLAPILGVVADQFGRLWEAIQRLGTAIGDFLAPIIKNVLTPVFVALGAVVGGVMSFVLENLILLADFLTGVISGDWQPFVDEVTRLGTVLRGWWEDFTAWFGPAWDTFWNETLPIAWNDFTTWFSDAWDNFWTVEIPKAWDDWATSMAQLWDTFWNETLPTTWTTFGDWMDGAWSGLLDTVLPGIWDAFTAEMAGSWDLLWSDTLPNLLQDGLDKVGEFMDTFWNVTFPGLLSDGFDGVQWLFEHFWDTVVPAAITKFTDWFGPMWDTWWAEASTGWLDDFDFAKEWDNFWSTTVPTAWGTFTTWFSGEWDTFWSVTLPDFVGGLGISLLEQLDGIGGTIGTWFDGLVGDFGTNWSTFWNTTLPDFVGQLGIDVLNMLTGNVDVNLFGWLDTLVTNFGTEWNTFWNVTLPDFVSGLWTGMTVKLDEMGANIGSWWTTFSDWLGGLWDDFWGSTLVDSVASLSVKSEHPLDDFRAMVSRKWDEFKSWLGGLWDDFWGTDLPQKAETVTPAVATKWEAFKTMLSGKWNEFKSWLGGLWDSFWGTDLPGKADKLSPAVGTKMDEFKGMLSRKWEEAKAAVIEKVNGLITSVTGLFNGWSFPDIGGLLQDHIVKPFQTAWEDITRLVGQITGAVTKLTSARSAMDAANAALGNAVAGQAVANRQAISQTATPRSVGTGLAVRGPLGDGLLRALANLPGLATGGIVPAVPGGTMFRLGEGGQRERVEPLAADGLSSRDRAMIKTIVASTISTMSGGGVNVDVRIGENGLNDFVTQTIRRENSDLARRVGKVKR